MDHSPPGSSVHGISQARILEWVAISCSRGSPLQYSWASLVAQRQRVCLPMQRTGVFIPGQEDPLEKEMATHSSILAWEIPWTEEPGGLQFVGS